MFFVIDDVTAQPRQAADLLHLIMTNLQSPFNVHYNRPTATIVNNDTRCSWIDRTVCLFGSVDMDIEAENRDDQSKFVSTFTDTTK